MKKIIALAATLFAAIALTAAAPAQAYGWRGGACITQTGNNAAVCVDFHTVPSGNGQRVDQILVCVAQVGSTYDPDGSGFRGIKDTGVTYVGSSGSQLGGASIVEPNGATPTGVCAYTTPNNPDQLGNGACFKVEGTLDLRWYPDPSFTIKGKVYPAGAYNC
jgi:hypothetical protein